MPWESFNAEDTEDAEVLEKQISRISGLRANLSG